MYLFFHSSMTSRGKPVIRALNLAGGEWGSWVKTSWRKEVASGGNRGGGLGPKQPCAAPGSIFRLHSGLPNLGKFN